MIVHEHNPSEPGPKRVIHPFKRVVFWMRIVVVLVAFGGLWHLTQRFELIKLPEDACSPLVSFDPGVSLLVDRTPEQLYLDDAVLFELPDGALGLGRIQVPPGSPAGTLRTDVGYWIRGDAPDCDTPDSQEYGAIEPSAIVARVLFPIRF
jgi:hypothetical protein